MKKVNVLHIDAFSSIPNMGNPAGVVLNGEDYCDEEMQYIAKQIGFNETAFVEQGHEMNKDGLVYVHVAELAEEISISISGTAVFVRAIELTL